MCGISALAGPRADRAALEAMSRALAHRGPDGEGVWASPHGDVALAHRRLAILDLSDDARQPIANEDGSVVAAYNGEIYNFRELRRGLEARGHRFRSATDSEVLVHLYEERGERMLDDLNGMFAFALYDARERRLLAARDETGIKPLYWAALEGGGVALASELKALAGPAAPRALGLDSSLDLAAIADYLAWGFIPDPATPLRAVRRLAPGHLLSWRDGKTEVRRWWAGAPPAEGDRDGRGAAPPRDLASAAAALREILGRAVARQLVSDRPVGAFLSGGLDSSAVVAAMVAARAGGEVRCYTMGYLAEDNALDPFDEDLPHARAVAARLGARLDALEVRAGEACALWPDLVRALDEPLADPAALNAYLIARRAREDGTVVLLSGQGADELFGGYRRHVAARLLGALDRVPLAARALRLAASAVPGGRTGRAGALLRRARKLLESARGTPDERFLRLSLVLPESALERALAPAVREALGGRDLLESGRALLGEVPAARPLDRALYRDLKTYLPAQNLHYTDRMTMASGVEARVPYLDDEVLAFALSLPPGLKLRGLSRTKAVLREAVRPWLPPEVTDRPKTGFGVPLRAWLRGGLRPLADDLLSRGSIARRGLLDPGEVERQRASFERGEADYAYAIFAYLTLELWCRAFLGP